MLTTTESLSYRAKAVTLLTTKQAGAVLGVTSVRVRQLIAEGRLKAEKHGRDYLIDSQEVARFNLEERRPGGRPRVTAGNKPLRTR